ncbi:MAG: 1-deoxy-D-xylulose-5-phosphate reductoisomerase [Thermoguttaceae bacterium]
MKRDSLQWPPFPRRIALCGATGSIGRGALDVVAASRGELVATLVAVRSQTDILAAELHKLVSRGAVLPDCIIVTEKTAPLAPLDEFRKKCDIRTGVSALESALRENEFGVSIVLSAIVGIAGLASTRAALEAGITVALANKESLVVGGELLTSLARDHGARIIPVDSEHSGVMQCLNAALPFDAGDINNVVKKIVLTASGGPFRHKTLKDLEHVTVADALAHPTWQMGRKVTIDSATLINKGLELIEARWLFGVEAERLGAVIHPASMVHAMVEFVDGSVVAQMSPPDMRLPIQLALTYPHRTSSPATQLDWSRGMTLEFFPIDFDRFPAVRLGLEVAAAGGTAGVVMNAANEAAVEAFLSERLRFCDIVRTVERVVKHHNYEPNPSWERLIELDQWARREV